MELQCIRKKQHITNRTAVKPVQTVVEAEAALPGSLRDETEIFYCGGRALITGSEVTANRIMADGCVQFRLIYAQGDLSKLKPMEISAEFSQALSIPNEFNNMQEATAHIQVQVQHVSTKVISGRVILKAILMLSGYWEENNSITTITGIEGLPGVQKKIRELTTVSSVGEGQCINTIRDEIELSDLLQINETLFASAYPVLNDIRAIGEGKVRLIGTIHLDAWHTSEMPGRPIISTVHSIPYEQEVLMSGQSGQILMGVAEIRDAAVISQNAADHEEKIMRCEITVESKSVALAEEKITFLEDAYTTMGENLQCSYADMELNQAFVQEEIAESGRIPLSLPEGSARVKQALVGFATPILLKKQKSGAKLLVNGVMDISVLYMTDDSSKPVSTTLQAPFSAAFSTQLEPDDSLELSVTEPVVSAVTGDRLELKYILHLKGHGTRSVPANMITEASLCAGKEVKKGITVCFIQPEETLWDVSKRYRVAPDLVKMQNVLDQDSVKCGDALVVYHK